MTDKAKAMVLASFAADALAHGGPTAATRGHDKTRRRKGKGKAKGRGKGKRRR